MGTWEDYFRRVNIKGRPAEIKEFAARVGEVGNRLEGYGQDAKRLVTDSDGDGKATGKGWQGPAGRAYRGYTTERVVKPFDDRAVKLSPVKTQLEAAAGFLEAAQAKMPRAAVGVSEGYTVADAETGEIEGSFDWKSVAEEWYGNGLENIWLSWNGGPSWLLPKGKPAGSPEIQGQIDAWYTAGSAAAQQVYDELDAKYSGIAYDLKVDAYKPKADDGTAKDTVDPSTTGGKDTGGGGDPTGTKPKATDKDTAPETKPETKPESKPEDTEPERNPEQNPEQNPEAEGEQPPGEEQQPEEPPGTEPEPVEPDPYEPDPYEPTPYEPPETGLASAGGGGGGGGVGGGGLGAGGGPATIPAAGTGLSAPTAPAPGGAGVMAVGAAGAGGLGRGGMAPMGGHGGGAHGGQQETETWLTEDEDPWRSDENTAPPVVGL